MLIEIRSPWQSIHTCITTGACDTECSPRSGLPAHRTHDTLLTYKDRRHYLASLLPFFFRSYTRHIFLQFVRNESNDILFSRFLNVHRKQVRKKVGSSFVLDMRTFIFLKLSIWLCMFLHKSISNYANCIKNNNKAHFEFLSKRWYLWHTW